MSGLEDLPTGIYGNTLGDLTKRENRYGHNNDMFPFDSAYPATFNGPAATFPQGWWWLRLPTYIESASPTYWQGMNPQAQAHGGSAGGSFNYGGINRDNANVGVTALQQLADYWTGQLVLAAGNSTDLYRPAGYSGNYFMFGVNGPSNYPEDRIMDYAIGFDVKAWDPGAPIFACTLPGGGNGPPRTISLAPGDPGWVAAAYGTLPGCVRAGYGAFVDLGYGCQYAGAATGLWGSTSYMTCTSFFSNPTGAPMPHFNKAWVNQFYTSQAATVPFQGYPGINRGGAHAYLVRTYDTWSTHYDKEYNPQMWSPPYVAPPSSYEPLSVAGGPTSGFDITGKNGPDGPTTSLFGPPYPYPLRAIQVTIRAMDPDSRQVREVTVVQDFLPR
jgi:hypothetical protein